MDTLAATSEGCWAQLWAMGDLAPVEPGLRALTEVAKGVQELRKQQPLRGAERIRRGAANFG